MAVRRISSLVNLRGELFATTFCFAMGTVMKFIVSPILTRLLLPEAYGIVTIISSIAFIVEMLSDVGIVAFLVRYEKGDDPRVLNTLWTLRLIRALTNGAIVFLAAPWIAQIYNEPSIVWPLRIYALWFVFFGFESISMSLAVRRKKFSIIAYTELIVGVFSNIFVIVFSYFHRDPYGMIYGMLLNRFMVMVVSYFIYPDSRPRFTLDRDVARALFGFTKFVWPSSVLALFLNQFDKVVFLRLFDLHLLGLYGLAGNIAGAVDSLVSRICKNVMYPRCASHFRENAQTFHIRYYKENVKLFAAINLLPAVVGGAAHLIIYILFDVRYAAAAQVLVAFSIRGVLWSLAAPMENLLLAAGNVKIVLFGNISRVSCLVPGCLLGYYFGGFQGFLIGAIFEMVGPLVYYGVMQHRHGLMIHRYEILRFGAPVVAFVASALVSSVIYGFLPPKV